MALYHVQIYINISTLVLCSGLRKINACLVSRACTRICSITNKANSFHRTKDFWVHRRSTP